MILKDRIYDEVIDDDLVLHEFGFEIGLMAIFWTQKVKLFKLHF